MNAIGFSIEPYVKNLLGVAENRRAEEVLCVKSSFFRCGRRFLNFPAHGSPVGLLRMTVSL